MAQRILYEAPTLTIAYDYTDDWLYLDWHGSPNDEQVMAGAMLRDADNPAVGCLSHSQALCLERWSRVLL